jgi:lantibiotic transport system permease protein
MAIITFIHSFQSEWIKKKRSLGSWLIVVGALFTPSIIIAARLLHYRRLPVLYAANNFWTSLWRSSWESMAVFFLPMAAILATSLITQIEYRNNAWKQVHTLPLPEVTLFLSKLAVILVLMFEFFILFDLGVYAAAMLPWIVVGHMPYPAAALPLRVFLADTGNYMLGCLPIVTAQYMLSLRFQSFLVPVGVGFLTWVGAVAALSGKFGYLVPYAYTMLYYLRDDPKGRITVPVSQLNWLSIGYTLLFCLSGYMLFVTKRQKG